MGNPFDEAKKIGGRFLGNIGDFFTGGENPQIQQQELDPNAVAAMDRIHGQAGQSAGLIAENTMAGTDPNQPFRLGVEQVQGSNGMLGGLEDSGQSEALANRSKRHLNREMAELNTQAKNYGLNEESRRKSTSGNLRNQNYRVQAQLANQRAQDNYNREMARNSIIRGLFSTAGTIAGTIAGGGMGGGMGAMAGGASAPQGGGGNYEEMGSRSASSGGNSSSRGMAPMGRSND